MIVELQTCPTPVCCGTAASKRLTASTARFINGVISGYEIHTRWLEFLVGRPPGLQLRYSTVFQELSIDEQQKILHHLFPTFHHNRLCCGRLATLFAMKAFSSSGRGFRQLWPATLSMAVSRAISERQPSKTYFPFRQAADSPSMRLSVTLDLAMAETARWRLVWPCSPPVQPAPSANSSRAPPISSRLAQKLALLRLLFMCEPSFRQVRMQTEGRERRMGRSPRYRVCCPAKSRGHACLPS